MTCTLATPLYIPTLFLRSFLGATKDEILLRQRKLERVEELLDSLDFEAFRKRFLQHTEPFGARIEDASTIIDEENDDVAPR